MNENNMNKIKEARIAAGLTQQHMSDLIGIPIRTIADWDRGVRTPPTWVERLVIAEINRIAELEIQKPLAHKK